MIIKKFARTTNLEPYRRWFLASGQLCLLFGILLSRSGDPAGAFLTGMLFGYAMVANLFFLISLRERRNKEH